MSTPVPYVPHGYHTVTPYLVLSDAARALEFYKEAFGAKEIMRMDAPGGKVGHAEIQIGDSHLMLGDECPQRNSKSPATLGGTPLGLCLYVEDCDAMFAKAISLGGKMLQPVTDQFYGDRSGTLTDPWGHLWTVATHKEDVTPEEIHKRLAAMGQKC